MVKDDGSECTGCANLGVLRSNCRKGHELEYLDGCRKCGKPVRKEVYLHIIGWNKDPSLERCNDYAPDPNYWGKDPYG